jgi:hypothetical protein
MLNLATLTDQCPILAGLSIADAEAVANQAIQINPTAGTRLFDIGNACQSLPLVLSGCPWLSSRMWSTPLMLPSLPATIGFREPTADRSVVVVFSVPSLGPLQQLLFVMVQYSKIGAAAGVSPDGRVGLTLDAYCAAHFLAGDLLVRGRLGVPPLVARRHYIRRTLLEGLAHYLVCHLNHSCVAVFRG